MLDWSLSDLSDKSGIGTTTLKRFEAAGGVPNGNISTFIKLKDIFIDAGIEFIGTPEDGPGVRLRK